MTGDEQFIVTYCFQSTNTIYSTALTYTMLMNNNTVLKRTKQILFQNKLFIHIISYFDEDNC